MLPIAHDHPGRTGHAGLLAASADHRETAIGIWARSVLDRGDTLLGVAAPIDTDIATRAGSGLTALTADDLHTVTAPVDLLRHALTQNQRWGDRALGVLVWADAVITATSPDTHAEVETLLTDLCRDHRISVLCVYDRPREGDGAGTNLLDLAIAHHPDELHDEHLTLRRNAHTLHVDGEIDMTNLDVLATALRALTPSPARSVRIDLQGVTFFAAAAARTVIRGTAAYRENGARVEIHATPFIARILQLLRVHTLPQLQLTAIRRRQL